MPIDRGPNTFSDNEPGAQPIVRPQFEEWAAPDDQHIAYVMEPHLTYEGRWLDEGDIITPAQARNERVRWRYVDGKHPYWDFALSTWRFR